MTQADEVSLLKLNYLLTRMDSSPCVPLLVELMLVAASKMRSIRKVRKSFKVMFL